MLFRKAILDLKNWLGSSQRKPLVLRGARQVGKTYLVDALAQQSNKELITLNFERQPELFSLFESNDPTQILLQIEAYFKKRIQPPTALLFLDEIQAKPELLAKLRWFAEEMPTLPVIAAGSLLDFSLSDHKFSMPVGRINYFYLEPLSFNEFIKATNGEQLIDYLCKINMETEVPDALHNKLMQQVNEYCLIGGMPAAINAWKTEKSLLAVNQVHHDLLSTYRDDFAKYPTRIAPERLQEILKAIPNMLGKKFTLRQVSPDVNASTIRKALNLLCLARIVHKVQSVTAEGLPLGAGIKEKYYKVIMLDTALASTSLGLHPQDINLLTLKNNGAIAEAFVGQQLRVLFPHYQDPELYYWMREGYSSAEIDYVIQHKNNMIPIEVKAGATGKLRSLHQYMQLRQLKYAVRIHGNKARITEISTKLQDGSTVNYKLLSIPFYLTNELPRLLDEWI